MLKEFRDFLIKGNVVDMAEDERARSNSIRMYRK